MSSSALIPAFSLPESYVQTVPSGRTVRPGRVFQVVSGYVRVFRAGRSGRVSVGGYGPGMFFGLTSLVGPVPNEIGFAKTPVQIMSWDPAAIKVACREDQRFASFVLMEFARANEVLIERLQEMRETADKRLANVLLRMAKGLPGSPVVLPAVTHQDLAADAISTREIVTQYMNNFRRAGAVNYDRKRIEVYPDLLRRVANLDAQ